MDDAGDRSAPTATCGSSRRRWRAAGAADRKKVADAIRTMDLTDGPARFFPGGRAEVRRQGPARRRRAAHRPVAERRAGHGLSARTRRSPRRSGRSSNRALAGAREARAGRAMNGRLAGKVALVAGAGSVAPGWSNGKATSVLFAREGAKVFAVDRDLGLARRDGRGDPRGGRERRRLPGRRVGRA